MDSDSVIEENHREPYNVVLCVRDWFLSWCDVYGLFLQLGFICGNKWYFAVWAYHILFTHLPV